MAKHSPAGAMAKASLELLHHGGGPLPACGGKHALHVMQRWLALQRDCSCAGGAGGSTLDIRARYMSSWSCAPAGRSP